MRLFTLSKPLQLKLEEIKLEYKQLRQCAEFRKPAGYPGESHRRS